MWAGRARSTAAENHPQMGFTILLCTAEKMQNSVQWPCLTSEPVQAWLRRTDSAFRKIRNAYSPPVPRGAKTLSWFG
jgi:hypothetical protein